tara:strand:+ start:572 stop:889 length:318 start_codon:yes stop_codon:yes gene_type:complete
MNDHLLTAIGGSLVAAIVALWRMQVKRADKCDKDHDTARAGLLKVTEEVGELKGKAIIAIELTPKIDTLHALAQETAKVTTRQAETFEKLHIVLDGMSETLKRGV